MNQVAKRDEQVPAEAPSEIIAFVQMIERAARDPNCDVDKMERLLAMQERVIERTAKAAYQAALVKMKPKLPVIDRKGRIVIRDKATKEITQSTGYALWEDIDEKITPILAEHGFALTFRAGVAQDGKITVTGVLSHENGHSEETTITLPHDSSGSKNAVQAVGSSTAYGKRYTATLLLNIRTKGEDDDGGKGGAPAVLNDEQVDTIQKLVLESGANVAGFLNFFMAESISDIQASKYKEAVALLEQKKRAKQS
jgi:hypothetical protein